MARELPIFPLPIVLFPGAPQPLHIFEPRYRQLLQDSLAADRRFGIAYVAPDPAPDADPVPSPGDVGCVALIRSNQPLPDGRSNVLTVGERRFVLRCWISSTHPYRVAEIEEFDDDPTDATEVPPLAPDVRQGFGRLPRALGEIVGARHVRTALPERITYARDGLPTHRRVPGVVVLPGSRDEVVAVVRLLAALGVPFVPRGAGTGLSGGALANDDAVLMVLTRLNRILAIDPRNRIAVVEPGVVKVRLSAAAAPHGLYYSPDPSSQTACTIGGNVAENAGGPHCLKYGVTATHVLGLEVVLADGQIVELGSLGGEPWGPDLVGLFVGSEGNFGIATRIRVRLLPVPRAIRTLLADFSALRTAGEAVSAVIASGIVPAALEMMDQSCINAVEDSVYAAGYPRDAAAVLLV